VRVMPLAVRRGGDRNAEAFRSQGEYRAAKGRHDEFLGPGRAQGQDKKPGEPPNLRIAEVLLEKLQLAYRDEASERN